MPGADRREETYREARGELLRQIDRDGLADLADAERRTEIARRLRALCERWPELDGQLSRRLMAEAAGPDAAAEGARVPAVDPSSGHANVTTLRRDDRRWVR